MQQRLHCCVQGCNAPAQPGHLTCSTQAHRTWEENRDERSTSMFQLRRRLQRFGISEIPAAGSSSQEEPPTHYARDPPTTDPPSTSNVKGSMSRRWTHNEQLFVRCCGIILSRATFYGSEGVSGVKVHFLFYLLSNESLTFIILPGLLEMHISAPLPRILAFLHFLR